MTAIVVDIHEDKIYVCADGRVTTDDIVITDTDLKIIKADDDNVYTMCGDTCVITAVINNDYQDLKAEGTVIHVSSEGVRVLDFSADAKYTTTEFPLDALPLFFGSGSTALRAAYNMPFKGPYLTKVKRCYEAAAKVVTSMNGLTQVETLDI